MNCREIVSKKLIFWNKPSKNIIIPASVEIICQSVFAKQFQIESVIFTENNKVVQSHCFTQCVHLRHIYFSNIEYINAKAFSHCVMLNKLNLPGSLIAIGPGAFEYNTKVTDITIPEGLKHIGNAAFRECSSIMNLTIPKSVEDIGQFAFHRCMALQTIDIQSTKCFIQASAFADCSQLTHLALPRYMPEIPRSMCFKCYKLCTIIFPVDLHTICDTAFMNCKSLKIPKWPETLRSIRSGAFYGCSFTNVQLTPNIRYIGSMAFAACYNLYHVSFSKVTDRVENEAFEFCFDLDKVTIPYSVQMLSRYAFPNNTEVTFSPRFSIYHRVWIARHLHLIRNCINILTRIAAYSCETKTFDSYYSSSPITTDSPIGGAEMEENQDSPHNKMDASPNKA